jgi:hypothetical protein
MNYYMEEIRTPKDIADSKLKGAYCLQGQAELVSCFANLIRMALDTTYRGSFCYRDGFLIRAA